MVITKLLKYIGEDTTIPIAGINEDIVIDGKEYNSSWFKPGNQIARENKGTQHTTTIAAKLCKAKTVKEFKALLATVHLERFNDVLNVMSDDDFAKFMLTMLPTIIPKLNAIDYKANDNKVYDITELQSQSTHTITVKDMRNNSITYIPE